MAVTYTQEDTLGDQYWRLSYESDSADPTYYVYINGVLSEITEREFVDINGSPGEAIQVEVLDSASTLPRDAFPPRAYLRWYRVTGAVTYRIDQFVDSEWTEVARVDDRGEGYFTWRSQVLSDDTYQFRLVPLAASGDESTALEFTFKMVSAPPQPGLTVTYNEGDGTITLDEP